MLDKISDDIGNSMNNFKFFAPVVFIATILSGCVGTYVTKEELNSFIENYDTKSTVNAKLGKPNGYVDINGEFGNNFREIIHTYDLYVSEFSLNLTADNESHYPKKVTVFVYEGANNVLVEGVQFTCFSKDECDNDYTSVVSKYVSDDQRRIENEIRRQQNDLQEKRAYMARLEEQRRQEMIREQKLRESKKVSEIVKVTSGSKNQNSQRGSTQRAKQTTKENVLD